MKQPATMSYVSGPTNTPLLEDTIGEAFDRAVKRFGDREALVSRHQQIRLTFNELNDQVDRLMAGLLALGLRPGDRIGIWAPNCVEWMLVQYATAKAGLVLVNINPAYRRDELRYALNKVECRALVLAPKFKKNNYVEMLTSLEPDLESEYGDNRRSSALPHLQFAIVLGSDAPGNFLSFNHLMEHTNAGSLENYSHLRKKQSPIDAINIQFTSGTTGAPKGATLSHKNILNNAYFCGLAMQLSEIDRICVPVPLYHCFGMVMGNLTSLQFGSTVIYPSDSFDVLATLQTVEEEKCTALYGVPTMFITALEKLDEQQFDLSTLRTGIMAGSPCPATVMKRVMADMNMAEVTIAYGMTETSPISFQTLPADPLERRVYTVGSAHPHVEAKIVNESGETLETGLQGEVWVRGYSVMLGYWNDRRKTTESISPEGWMRTGDLGVIDESGCCRITGRLKDMVIRGGENIYPREIEEFLYKHPSISDIQVCGVPDDKFGEELCAWIIKKPNCSLDAESVKQYCDGKLAHYKVPRYIKFVDEFPMTVTGKVMKFEMRKIMETELQSNSSRES